MTETTLNDALVMLTVSPQLEDEVVDWLLSDPDTTGFTTVPAFGHGGPHHLLSVAEQVAGKRARVQFQIATTEQRAVALLTGFERAFPGANAHAWAIPLMRMDTRVSDGQ
jgi:hypothetical protein